MHRDQKIGLSLAVLIVGFAAAFSFRNEPLGDAQPLALSKTASIDARIEQLPIRAYTQREGVGEIPVESDLLDPASDLIDASLLERPAELMDVGDAPAGDVIRLFAGPPEPLRSSDFATVPSDFATSLHQKDANSAVAHPPHERPTSLKLAPPSQIDRPEVVRENPTEESPKVHLPNTDTADMRRYVVKSGDTLSGVSYQMYGTTRRYLEIYRANRDVLHDPNDLPVGTTLQIP